MANSKVLSNSGEREIQKPVEKPEKKPPFIDVTADPDYLKLVEYYQHAEFEKCGDLLNSLIKRYPDNLRLVEFQKDLEMQLSLKHISATYSIKEKQEKKKLTIRMSAFTVAGIALVVLVFAASFWFLSRVIIDQRQQVQASQLFSLESQVNELLQTGQPQVAAGIIEKMYEIDANYANLPVLSERTNFLLMLEADYQNALTLLSEGDYNGALLILRDINEAQPGLWDVARQISKAEKKVQVTAFLQAGNDAYLSGKWGEVITAYESAMEQDPSLNDGLMKEQLLNSYLRRIIQMLESDSTNIEDIEIAEEYYRKAVAMIPQSKAFASERENLQRVSSGLLELKFTQIAKGLLEQKAQTFTTISQAVAYLSKAANLDPDNAQLQSDLKNAELYRIAFQYYLDMNWGLTIDNLNPLIAIDQNYANGNANVLLYESYYALGNQYYAVGEYAQAKTNLEQAETLAYADRVNLLKLFQVQMLLGDTVFKMGDHAKAVSYYQYALNSAGVRDKAFADPGLSSQLTEAEGLVETGNTREAAMVYYLIHQQIPRIYTVKEIEATDGACLAFLAVENLSTSDAISLANDLPKSSIITFGRTIKVPTLD